LATVYAVDVLGPLGLIQASLPLLRASSRGAIVDVTSDAAVDGLLTG
jgi:NAD(P)-dependent dehydrogenase (short-subunit alcohol dehydrogenase family)